MPDDPMTGLRDLFNRSAPEPDPTSEIHRSHGGLGGLGRLVEPSPPTEASPQRTPAERDEPGIPQESRRARQQTANVGDGPTPSRRLRRKTSLSLSPAMQKRISQAFHRDRWTMAELVAEGVTRLQSGRVQNVDLERRLRSVDGPSSAIKTVSLALSDLDELDHRAATMRLSRSQLVAALLDMLLDDL